jgi:hypothetical protein
MDIVSRLPNELQTIIKYYTLCSPHTQSLIDERVVYYETYERCLFPHTHGLLESFHAYEEKNGLKEYRCLFGGEEYYGSYSFYLKKGHRNKLCSNPYRPLLYFYMFRLIKKKEMIYFIESNLSLAECDALCRSLFQKPYSRLNINEYKRIMLHLYHTL